MHSLTRKHACLLLLASCAATAFENEARPAAPTSKNDLADIPNVTVEYYQVEGMTGDEIRSSMNARRPRDSHDGQAVEAVTSWELNWMVPQSGRRCDLSRAKVSFKARVLLPRLTDPGLVPAPVLARWRAFVAGLERHESYHVRHAFNHRRDVLRAIRSSSCARANEAAAAAVRKVGDEQRAYDVATRHGALEVPPFP
jgi:predicted secreted Zn-dependent protease